ncbi:MAG TPA: 2Fe-2S iron-sulfur cluster-binding protein, partial [bacterium]|nr:2Fe-2S iron-sulfur cluster-binding protein [bacterium]
KVVEADGICSFHLAPHDGKPIPAFAPGQYLTFRLSIPGESKPVIRCYSLSSNYHPGFYRVSIKKVAPPPDKPKLPPGKSSSYFVDTVREGDLLDVRAPAGGFVLSDTDAPVVLIGGGIGVTPVLAMLRALIAAGAKRETWFFYCIRNKSEHALKEEIEALAAESPNVKLKVLYSNPTPNDIEGKDFHEKGRISVDVLKKHLPSSNYEFYLCGPPAMMESMGEGLRGWGVPGERVFAEAFGPAAVKKTAAPAAAPAPGATGPKVTFAKSGKTVTWTGAHANLLELAAACEIKIDSGCGAGSCGTCLTAMKEGSVDYVKKPDSMPEGGSCLVCIGVPKGDVVLDA